MTRWALPLCAALLLSACPKKPRLPVGGLGLDQNPIDKTTDLATLRRELAIAVRESYVAFSGGYEEAYLDALARDARLVLIDVGPEAVMVGYDPGAVKLRLLFPDHPAEVKSKRLEVRVSPDGTTGWSYDELSYRVLHEGRRVIIPLRATGVYERRNGRWLLVQQHVSYALPEAELWRIAPELPEPAALGDWTSPTAEAREVRALLERLVVDTDDARAEAMSAATEPLLVAPDPDRELRGQAAVETATVRGLFGYDATVSLRDLRVKSSATGQVVWAAANVVVDNGQSGKKQRKLPLRVTWVVLRDGGTWRVVQMHASAGLSSEEMQLRVFGERIF